jgi:hypothetical protein
MFNEMSCIIGDKCVECTGRAQEIFSHKHWYHTGSLLSNAHPSLAYPKSLIRNCWMNLI